MATTLLQALQEMHGRLHLSGSAPNAVSELPQEQDEVLVALKQANRELVTAHIDWQFLWSDEGTVTFSVGGNPNTPSPATIGEYDEKTFYYDGVPLPVIPYVDYKKRKYSAAEQADTSSPQNIVILPNKRLLVLPYPDDSYEATFDFWAALDAPEDPGDELQIPDDSLEALYTRTKMIWAGDQEAPNYNVLAEDFRIAFSAMEDRHWPGKKKASMAEDQEFQVVST